MATLVIDRPYEVKEKLDRYIYLIEQEKESIKIFIDCTSTKLEYWCNKYSSVYTNKIKLIYPDYFIDKLCKQLYAAAILDETLDILYIRCMQFYYIQKA